MKPTIDAVAATYPVGQDFVTQGQHAGLSVQASDADTRNVPVDIKIVIDGMSGLGNLVIPFSDNVMISAVATNAQIKPDPNLVGRFDVVPLDDRDVVVTITASDEAGDFTKVDYTIKVKAVVVPPEPPVPEPPQPTGWPDASTTGYKGVLTTVGSVTPVAGKVHENLLIQSPVVVGVAGSTFRNCWAQQGFRIATGSTSPVVTIEDTKLGGMNPGFDGSILGNGGFIARRCDISRSVDFVRIGDYGPAELYDSFLHDLRLDIIGAHNDGLQHYSGNKTPKLFVVKHNNFQCQGATTSALFMADDWRGELHLIENLFQGGNTGVRLHESGSYRVRGNRWVKGSFGPGGALSTIKHGPILDWTDNAYTDGTVIPKPA